jgi:hypothetical protein
MKNAFDLRLLRNAAVIVVFIVMLGLTYDFVFGHYEPVRARVQEGVTLSTPARLTFGFLCVENKLQPGLAQDDPKLLELRLKKPDQYHGTHVKSVTLSVQGLQVGTVTVVYKEIYDRFTFLTYTLVEDGATQVWRGECGAGGAKWSIDPASTLPEKYRSRL